MIYLAAYVVIGLVFAWALCLAAGQAEVVSARCILSGLFALIPLALMLMASLKAGSDDDDRVGRDG